MKPKCLVVTMAILVVGTWTIMVIESSRNKKPPISGRSPTGAASTAAKYQCVERGNY